MGIRDGSERKPRALLKSDQWDHPDVGYGTGLPRISTDQDATALGCTFCTFLEYSTARQTFQRRLKNVCSL